MSTTRMDKLSELTVFSMVYVKRLFSPELDVHRKEWNAIARTIFATVSDRSYDGS
jgi:hypothetical protein